MRIPYQILKELETERKRQEQKHGRPDGKPRQLHPYTWMGIIGEEYGEVQQAINDQFFTSNPDYRNYRKELIELAASAIAAADAFDYWDGEIEISKS